MVQKMRYIHPEQVTVTGSKADHPLPTLDIVWALGCLLLAWPRKIPKYTNGKKVNSQLLWLHPAPQELSTSYKLCILCYMLHTHTQTHHATYSFHGLRYMKSNYNLPIQDGLGPWGTESASPRRQYVLFTSTKLDYKLRITSVYTVTNIY